MFWSPLCQDPPLFRDSAQQLARTMLSADLVLFARQTYKYVFLRWMLPTHCHRLLMFPFRPAFLVLTAFFGSSLSAELPEVPGAKIVRDLSVGSAQFVHYLSSNVSYTKATHALIAVHGKGRDAYNTFAAAQAGVNGAIQGGIVREGSVVIAAPVFFNGTSLSGRATDRAQTSSCHR
jgi:hypothetical protein